MLDILAELRSFFLGGRTGGGVHLPQSDDSSESGFDRFSPNNSGDWSSAGAGGGDAGVLGTTVG